MRTRPLSANDVRSTHVDRPAARRRRAVLLAPVAVPVSMSAVFAALARRLPPRHAYNAGFAVYWAGWCVAFPCWVLGPRRCAAVLRRGRGLTPAEAALALLPVVGAATTTLWPNRRSIDGGVASVMLGTAVGNAVGEELLWRGTFAEQFPGDAARGVLWPLAGFALWHLAPQIVLPARIGRWRFVLGAALVGSGSNAIAWRTGGLRSTLLPHIATDACGVAPARFRLGRGDAGSAANSTVGQTDPVVVADIVIARSVEVVFDYVTDIQREPEWNPQLRNVRKLTAGPIGAGTAYRVRFGRGVGEATIANVAYDRPRTWTAVSRSRWLDVRAEGQVDPMPAGSRLTVRTEFHPRGPLLPMAPMLPRMMRAAWARDLRAIKNRLES